MTHCASGLIIHITYLIPRNLSAHCLSPEPFTFRVPLCHSLYIIAYVSSTPMSLNKFICLHYSSRCSCIQTHNTSSRAAGCHELGVSMCAQCPSGEKTRRHTAQHQTFWKRKLRVKSLMNVILIMLLLRLGHMSLHWSCGESTRPI